VHTELFTSLPFTSAFRLWLDWEPGYLWQPQESLAERWFCMACARCDADRSWEECAI
jgi:hypothetical protein